MKRTKLLEAIKREGWLLAALALCVGLCLIIGATQSSPTDDSRIGRVLSEISGAGVVSVAVYREDTVPCGAVVVADGAHSISVQLRLRSALSALMGLDPERIAVYPREGGR